MLLSTMLTATFATLALSNPLQPRAASWTIQNFTRTCNDTANACHYSYAINTNTADVAATGCAYDIKGTSTTSARQAPYNLNCGPFAIGSTWSGQFGPNNGFQTLSAVKSGQIVFPAYSDAELVDGMTVTPDKSYLPQTLAVASNVVVHA